MAYTIVPVDINETFSVSQPKITANFAAINTVVSVDHETFDSAGGVEGKHKQVTFNVQSSHPTTVATEVKLYSKNNAAGNPALWFQKSGVAASAPGIDFTTATLAMPGYCWLPCGIKMIWGTVTIPAGTQGATTTFTDSGFPNNVITVMIVKNNLVSPALGDDSIVVVNNKTKTTATLSRVIASHVGTSAVMEYLAIGY
jgi:hypothetical protein